MHKKCITIIALILLWVTGCTKEPDVVVSNNTTETTSKELVSVEYFMEYYGLTQEDIVDVDIEAMIDDFEITEDMLVEDGDFWLKCVYRSMETGRKFGYDADEKIEGNKRQATKEDNLSSAKYVMMSIQILEYDGLHHTQQIILDLEKKKSYYSYEKDVWNYFYDAEIQKELDQETIDELINSLEKKKIYKWKASDGPTGDRPGDYIWSLYIVMDRGDVITYSGNDPGNNKNLDTWYNELLDVVK